MKEKILREKELRFEKIIKLIKSNMTNLAYK